MAGSSAPIPDAGGRRRRRVLADGYANAPMRRPEAERIREDVGRLISEHDADGKAIPRTARVDLRPTGEGYDLSVPAELINRLYMAGYRDGVRARKATYERER